MHIPFEHNPFVPQFTPEQRSINWEAWECKVPNAPSIFPLYKKEKSIKRRILKGENYSCNWAVKFDVIEAAVGRVVGVATVNWTVFPKLSVDDTVLPPTESWTITKVENCYRYCNLRKNNS